MMKFVDEDDPVLRREAEDVTDAEKEVRPLVAEMKALLERTPNAAGFAAPQVGVGLRFFVVRSWQGEGKMGVFINPVIRNVSGTHTSKLEGCLSFEGGRRKTYVRRHDWVDVDWWGLDGLHQCMRFVGDAARVMQHEIDHLDGVCIFPEK